MGSEDDKFPRNKQNNITTFKSSLKIILLILATNAITFVVFSGNKSGYIGGALLAQLSSSGAATAAIIRELNSTRSQLASTDSKAADLHARLRTSNLLLESLLTEIGRANRELQPADELEGWKRPLKGELAAAVGPHKLPLGHNGNIGSDELFPAMGGACRRFQEELEKYMEYQVGQECPSDYALAERLMLKGCEPLPRRRCRNTSPKGYVEPTPLPTSLWSVPPDTNVVWDPYTCKNFDCVINRRKEKKGADCRDCFDMSERGNERRRWTRDDGNLQFSIDYVLGCKPPGTVRIGLDIGGGTGTFAARMAERNVNVVLTTMNFDGPFNSFVASRGLIPLYITVGHRLPFFDATLDIVHSMHVLSHWLPNAVLEFVLYDIYRVLRPGGLFWLDHFFGAGDKMNSTYVPAIERVGFKKIRWSTGAKLDQNNNEWYISALLEKPLT